jgi:hypothetical protein
MSVSYHFTIVMETPGMSAETNQVVATLAAAIVVSRGAKNVAEIRDAWTDAGWIISPAPSNSRYKAWQEKHGETPRTPEEDADVKRLAKEQAQRLARKLA